MFHQLKNSIKINWTIICFITLCCLPIQASVLLKKKPVFIDVHNAEHLFANLSLNSYILLDYNFTKILWNEKYPHQIFVASNDHIISINTSFSSIKRIQLLNSIFNSNIVNQQCPTKQNVNRIKQLFLFNKTLFACDTKYCGMCFIIDNQLTTIEPYGDFSVNSFLIGHRSSLAFFGKYRSVDTLYVAYEFDGRNKSLAPPYISARSFQKTGMCFSLV